MSDTRTPETITPTSLVLVARLVRPQGRHGEILADILTDFPERFSDRKRLFLQKAGAPSSAAAREVALERHWLHKGRVVLKFAGIDSINDAELLRGFEVAIPIEERAPLEDGAVYIEDLKGCRVFDVSGSRPPSGDAGPEDSTGQVDVGEVVDVDRESTAHPLLVLRGTRGEEVLIPFVKALVVSIDVANKRLVVRLPEGLLHLNSPLTAEERARQVAEERGNAGQPG